MFNPIDLTDKHILITGASSGIGKSCAIYASKLGAKVTLVARRLECLEDVRLQMDNEDKHHCIKLDLSDLRAIKPTLETIVKAQKLDGIIHSAGSFSAIPVGLISTSDAQKAFDLNVLSFLEIMKCCSKKKFINDGFASVVISSASAMAGFSGGTLYSATKGAVSAMVRALAIELATKKIRVNAICPSNIKTPMFDAIAGDINDEAALQELLKKQPLGLGEPEHVAASACFLLSKVASFITGVNLPVDGGYLAQ